MAKDNFSRQSTGYAAFRPKLPREVFDFVLQHVTSFNLAWDVGTGNGQAAAELAKQFTLVVATDISESQLAHAVQLPNIVYRKEPAEHSSLENKSVDLITIAQAIHWFDFGNFYKEVHRVAKPGAVIAAFSYSMFTAKNNDVDAVIQRFYAESAPYWDEERKYVDEQYRTIPFPFSEMEAPVFYIHYEWTIEQLLGYIGTWSANQHYIRKHGRSMVTDEFQQELLQHLNTKEELIQLRFPVYMRIGKI